MFDFLQFSLSIADVVATVGVLHSSTTLYWLDMAIRCNLQFFAGTTPVSLSMLSETKKVSQFQYLIHSILLHSLIA